MNDVQIRMASSPDEPVIYQFICTLEETVLDRAAFQTIFAQNLKNPTIHYFVAEKAGTIVGFISCHIQLLLHHTGCVGEIQELFVEPCMRKQGIGQQLVTEVKALAVRKNFVSLEVTTNRKRADAIGFYRRALFELTHVKLVNPVVRMIK